MKSLAYNRKARHEYEVIEKLEAGISLLGTEVKSIKAGHMSLRGAFVTMHDGQAFLINATVPPWQIGNAPADYDPVRARKLLLKKSELKGLLGAKKAKGLTIVPLRVYSKRGKVKVEVALARGRKKVDKKQLKRERDIKREMERTLKNPNV
jgi:SsrA-binding protein